MRIVKCKCGREFTSASDRAAHISKEENKVSKAVRSSFGYVPKHKNEPGTFVREKELAA